MSKYGPRPLVEEHYHIQMLIDQQDKRVRDRNYYREKAKEREDRPDIIKDAQVVVVTDFWCDVCKEDFKSMAIKEIEVDWTNSSQHIAFYRSKCDKGHWCMRLITDRHRDGFWSRSKRTALDRGRHFADTVQPYETNFNLLYGKR